MRVLAWLIITGISGCAHYNLPASHLETPEARGGGVGRLELAGVLMGTDLVERPVLSSPDPESGDAPEPEARSAVTPALGFVASLSEKIDLGVRLQPMAPLSVRFKYQLSGAPEASASQGNLSAALAIAPGILVGRSSGSTVTYYSIDLAVPAGYRLGPNHLLSLSPFLTLAGLSGTAETAARAPGGSSSPAGISATSGAGSTASATQYGVGLGYQYMIAPLWFRAEITTAGGSMGDTALGGYFFGVMTGFLLN
ncbi:MAG: hypothetical protein NDJ89_12450 [Oligoflexia bacterium]|nr:hypothetical protein [Oligoflexia bacterium]